MKAQQALDILDTLASTHVVYAATASKGWLATVDHVTCWGESLTDALAQCCTVLKLEDSL